MQYNRKGWAFVNSAPDPSCHPPRGCISAGGRHVDWEVVRPFLEAATGGAQWEPPRAASFIAPVAALGRVWDAPTTTNADRKRLLRCLVEHVTLESHKQARRIVVGVHWRGELVEDLECPRSS